MKRVHFQLDCIAGVSEQAGFLQWLGSKLQGDIYPGSPFERKYFAVLLLNHLLATWCDRQSTHDLSDSFDTSFCQLRVFSQAFIGPESSLALIGRQDPPFSNAEGQRKLHHVLHA